MKLFQFTFKAIFPLLLFMVLGNQAWSRTAVSQDGTTVNGLDANSNTDADEVPVQVVPTKVQGIPTNSGPNAATDDDGATGSEKRAQKYFRRKSVAERSESTDRDHYLAVHIGGFLSSDSYQWGTYGHVSDPGRFNGGLTYRIGALSHLADWALRGDFTSYAFPDGTAFQFSILPLLMFPDSASFFPLYFGLGVGPGIFFSQLSGESFLALDYQLIAGVRVFDVVDTTGFFVETGLKNHLLLFSDGQFNGFFLTAGALFAF